MLSPVSTWMGDRLGTLGAVGNTFYIATMTKSRLNMRLKMKFVLRGPVVKYQNVGTRFIFPRYVTFLNWIYKLKISNFQCPSSGGHILKLERYRED